ncbi:MAG: DMT family transporter [bacterium]|nr:DMT family transporter [bacterium]
MFKSKWFLYALTTVIFWGIWGAFINAPAEAGFPATLGYVVWAFTMIIPAVISLPKVHWKIEHDKRSILLGCIIGFTGAGGQLILFEALRGGPAYLIFPIISLSPVITIILSMLFLKEKTKLKGCIGIVIALIAIGLLSYMPNTGGATKGILWIILTLLVFLAWGLQAFTMKLANNTMTAESIFFYMMIAGLILIPFALLLTNFSTPINWGLSGPYLAAGVQVLNAIGALTLVFAFRYGKAIVVSPMANALAPVLTVIISLSLYHVIPSVITSLGVILAIASAVLLAVEEA